VLDSQEGTTQHDLEASPSGVLLSPQAAAKQTAHNKLLEPLVGARQNTTVHLMECICAAIGGNNDSTVQTTTDIRL
jgi:hypothetical protein